MSGKFRYRVTDEKSGKTWPTLKKAAEGIGVAEKTLKEWRMDHPCGGEYHGYSLIFEKANTRHQVKCVESGRIYKSSNEVADTLCYSLSVVNFAIKHGKELAGYHWERIERK